MQGLDEKHTINDTRLERKNHSSNFYFTRCKKKEKKRKLKIMKIKDFHFQLFHHCSTNSIVGNVEKQEIILPIYIKPCKNINMKSELRFYFCIEQSNAENVKENLHFRSIYFANFFAPY